MRIDFHAHILPGMDHGCKDLAMSLAQLNMATTHKINLIVATSHFYPHVESVSSFIRRRQEAWNCLKANKEKDSPMIMLGAEILLCNRIDKMEGIEQLSIENSNVLLIEMPLVKYWDLKLIDTVVRLKEEKRFQLVLAHGERYPESEVEKILEIGVLLQLNVASTTKRFPSQFVRRSMKQHQVVALGSDIHGLSNSYENFTRSMKRWGKEGDLIMKRTQNLIYTQAYNELEGVSHG